MIKSDILESVLNDTNYNLSLFRDDELRALRSKVSPNTLRGGGAN